MDFSNPECVVMSNRNQPDDFTQFSDCKTELIIDTSYYKKCGEIFAFEKEILFFSCILCQKTLFAEISNFFDHLKLHHAKDLILQKIDPLESNNDNECKILTKIEDNTEVIFNDELEMETDSNYVEKILKNQTVHSPSSSFEPLENNKSTLLLKDVKKDDLKISKEKDELFQCTLCNKKYALKSSLRRHIKCGHSITHNDLNLNQNDLLVSCDICNRKFASEKVLVKHKDIDHRSVDLFMKSSINEQQFYKSSEDDEDDLDNKANKTFLFTQEIQYIDPMKCTYCERKFNARLKRIEHERIHTGEKPYKCKFCGKCFRTSSSIRKHEMVHQGIKPHKCTICNTSFTEKSNLRQHIRRHIGDKKIPCKYCGKLFQQNSEKKIHERIHTGEKPFQCTVCGKCFTTSEKVDSHYIRHTNKREFKCKQCDKSFFTNRELTEHIIVHTGERPFTCDVCKATFPRRKSLKSHIKIHSDVTEYICSICGKGFKQRPGLYCHMKSHGITNKS